MSEGGGFGTAVAVVVVAGILGYGAYKQYEDAKPPTLEQQRACAEQSEKFFKGRYDSTASFLDHFSPPQSRCFIRVTTVDEPEYGQTLIIRKAIFDPFEGTGYGAFEVTFNEVTLENSINECSAVLADGKRRDCKSEDQWRALMKYTQ